MNRYKRKVMVQKKTKLDGNQNRIKVLNKLFKMKLLLSNLNNRAKKVKITIILKRYCKYKTIRVQLQVRNKNHHYILKMTNKIKQQNNKMNP